MPLKAVLFDNDGTLVDTYELIMSSYRHATREVLGEALPDEMLSAKIGQPLAVQVLDFTDDPEKQEALVKAYRAHNGLWHDKTVTAFPGALDALRRLTQAGLALGVVTAKRHALAWRGLEIVGAAPYLSCLVGADDCTPSKPDAAPVLMACRTLGVAPSACAYVGDSPYDIQSGNAAGCLTVAVTWGMFPEERLRAENPALVCATFEELVDLLTAYRSSREVAVLA